MADGRLWFNTKIDNSNVEKDLKDLQRKIERSQAAISKAKAAKLPYESQLKGLTAQIDEAKRHLDSLRADLEQTKLNMGPGASPEDYIRARQDVPMYEKAIKESEKKLASLQTQWDSVNGKVQKYDAEINRANTDIARNKAQIAQLGVLANSTGKRLSTAMEKASKSAQKFNKRLLTMAKRVFFFSVILKALRSVRDYVSKVFSTNEEYTEQLAKLKGALLTAFQPIYEYVLPGVIAVLKVITSIVQALTSVLAFFSGKSVDEYRKSAESLYNEANAIDKVGAAAKNAQKHLAGFDELNRLSSADGGGGASTGIVPDFSGWEDNMSAEGWGVVADLRDMITELRNVFVENSAEINAIVDNLGFILMKLRPMLDGTNKFARTSVGATIDFLIGLLNGFTEFLAGAFSGDWSRAWGGIGTIFKETGQFLEKILYGIKDSQKWYMDWLHNVFAYDWTYLFGTFLGSQLNNFFKFCDEQLTELELLFDGFIDFIAGTFTGDWQRAMSGLKNITKGILNGMISLINLLLRNAIDGLNTLFDLLNFDIKLPGGKKYSVDFPEIKNVPQIPMLAKGAVLPPNKPFMAMVGDQRNGTNIEAPLATIEEAVANVMSRNSGSMTDQQIVALLQSILEAVLGIELDGETLSNAVHAYDRKKAVILGG